MAFEGHKGRKAKKGQEGQKNKYGSKCLELSNSARNAKIAKNFQKVPKAWRSMDIRPNGLWSWNYIYIYVRNIMLIFIHHNLLNTIFRKKLTQANRHTFFQDAILKTGGSLEEYIHIKTIYSSGLLAISMPSGLLANMASRLLDL